LEDFKVFKQTQSKRIDFPDLSSSNLVHNVESNHGQIQEKDSKAGSNRCRIRATP
jgi:hypothetical protein